MPLHCAGIVERPLCTRVDNSGGHKRAIVLHPISGMSAETYINMLGTPLPDSCEAGQYPKSVHFIVTDTSAIQVAELSTTTFGLDYVNTNPLPHYLYFHNENINEQFIHIALFTDNLLSPSLINLICCIDLFYSTLFPVLASSDLQTDRPYLSIDPSLATCVSDCVISGAQAPLNNIEIQDRLLAVEQCCMSNRGLIDALSHRVYIVEEDNSRLRTRVRNLEVSVSTLQEQVAIIPSLMEAIRLIQIQIGDIINNCCPDTNPAPACWHYQILTSNQFQPIPPQQPVWLNPPKRITDADPPIVTPGPLWKANLSGPCAWLLDGSVRFRLSDWCRGKKVKLYITYCGTQHFIQEKTITTSGPQIVTMEFTSYPVPGGCDDVHLSIEHNDTDAKVIEFMNFKGCSTC